MMAESIEVIDVPSSSESEETRKKEECPICLESYMHPAKLPCGHVFCFLCIKGIALQSKRCALCRQEIPRDFIEKPVLLDNAQDLEIQNNSYQWYYEGCNGWWQYDERTNKDLEAAYINGDKSYEVLIAGFLYIIDMEAMIQIRRSDPSKCRKVKRDLTSIEKKGIAGLRSHHKGS